MIHGEHICTKYPKKYEKKCKIIRKEDMLIKIAYETKFLVQIPVNRSGLWVNFFLNLRFYTSSYKLH